MQNPIVRLATPRRPSVTPSPTKARRALVTALLGAALWLGPAARSHAEIRESTKMAEVLKEVDEGTLFITDLDNTVVETPQMLGSDQSYDYVVRDLQKKGDSREVAIDKALETWVSVQHVTRVQAVEADIPSLFKGLQERGVTVLALTARPLTIVATTERQMKDLGIDFARRPVRCKTRFFRAPRPALYERGILYSDRNNKGHVLTRFLRLCRLRPRKIVFVDDKVRNVTNVHRELNARWPKVRHVEFRYGAADARVKALDPKVLGVELEHFRKLLSDDEARGLLEKR